MLRYLIVCVGFLYTVVSMDPSGLREIRTTRKASCPSDLASDCNERYMFDNYKSLSV